MGGQRPGGPRQSPRSMRGEPGPQPGDRFGIGTVLWLIAAMLAAEGKFERSLRLFGAQPISASQPLIKLKTEQILQAARQALGEAACMALLSEGQAMSAQQAIAYAL